MPELAALLPPEAPPQAHPYTPLGLNGQHARATVYVQEVILPQAEEGVHERPKQALYHVSYRSISQPSYLSPTTVGIPVMLWVRKCPLCQSKITTTSVP